ncbi:hypothetical protein HW132_35170, partial [Brasilonema sp. CT11]|nr:hypothetical protein [Brasilonema sp. CT11]
MTTKTANQGGYFSVGGSTINGMHIATSWPVSSILVSNSTGVYLDLFEWSLPNNGKCVPPPTIPQLPPQDSTPQDSPSNGIVPSDNTQQPSHVPFLDRELDPVSLGVGLAVPLLVIIVGASLLAFFLRKRNKSRRQKILSQRNPMSENDPSGTMELPEIDKRLHIPYKSLVFIKEIGAGSYGKVFLW